MEEINTQTINHLIELNKEKITTNDISDGYHTFGELYDHRIDLFILLCNILYKNMPPSRHMPWKSKLHHDNTMYEGWFIAGIGMDPGEQISYHLPIARWHDLRVVAYDTAPEWDGSTSKDILERLKKLQLQV